MGKQLNKSKRSAASTKKLSQSGPASKLMQLLDRWAASPVFAQRYKFFALLVLFLTTIFWGLQSANLQLNNADQLVNPYLFEHAKTLHGALFPEAHSFLLKWPLFWLIKLFGFTSFAYIAVTILVVVITIAGLTYLLYRIERRPLIFGTLCLALASMLLLVPAQPYSGGFLPVNMAMLTTRNFEYLLYILSLVLIIKWPRFKSWQFWVGVAVMSLLIASDRLFLIMGAAGALLAIVAYALMRGWKMVGLAARWMVAMLAGTVISAWLFWLLESGRLTQFASAGTGPYSLASGVHGAALGFIYAVLGLLTNFGANPVYNVTVLRKIPHQLLVQLGRPVSIAYVINGVVLLFGLYLTFRILRYSLNHHKSEASRLDLSSTLSVLLVWSSLGALVSFVFTDHYYTADARYLSIALFAIFIATATALRQKQWHPQKVLLAGLVMCVGILAGLSLSNQVHNAQKTALSEVNDRNSTIIQVLSKRPSEVLVGDYWRVTPIKYTSGNKVNVMPLVGCTQPQSVLSSQVWQPNLNNHRFVYLLSLDHILANGYPTCTLKQVISSYGRPNASVLVSGTLSKPHELLLFYDLGAHKSAPASRSLPQGPSTVVPVTLEQLPSLSPPLCTTPTTMTFVAHEDDDLLFMNPDLIHSIKAGHCIRTVYVTAGDAGIGKFYWLGREQGSEAAYANMLGISNIWVERIVQLANNEFVSIASPRNNPRVSLIFFHLPDGNIHGQGFPASYNESLEKLESGKISAMQTVDRQSNYNLAQLRSALTALMHFYQPTEIRTQANYIGRQFPDHSDHMAVGSLVKQSYSLYEQQQFENSIVIPLKFYIGYPIHPMPANVSGLDLQAKTEAFLEYAQFDTAVCHNMAQCNKDLNISVYLRRQYQNLY